MLLWPWYFMGHLPANSIEDFRFLKLFDHVVGVHITDGLFCIDAITFKCENLGYVTCKSHKDETNT